MLSKVSTHVLNTIIEDLQDRLAGGTVNSTWFIDNHGPDILTALLELQEYKEAEVIHLRRFTL